jgi:hypothetical protein
MNLAAQAHLHRIPKPANKRQCQPNCAMSCTCSPCLHPIAPAPPAGATRIPSLHTEYTSHYALSEALMRIAKRYPPTTALAARWDTSSALRSIRYRYAPTYVYVYGYFVGAQPNALLPNGNICRYPSPPRPNCPRYQGPPDRPVTWCPAKGTIPGFQRSSWLPKTMLATEVLVLVPY